MSSPVAVGVVAVVVGVVDDGSSWLGFVVDSRPVECDMVSLLGFVVVVVVVGVAEIGILGSLRMFAWMVVVVFYSLWLG